MLNLFRYENVRKHLKNYKKGKLSMHVNLTYEQFVQELRNWIIKATHLPEDYVFFKKKEKTGITANGDRLFVVCAETDSGKDICGIFVEELYQDYVEGTSMENIFSINTPGKKV